MIKSIPISQLSDFRVGHAQDMVHATGCTAILCPKGAWACVDVRGGSPASRETELLRPENTVQQIHCVMLSGGSAYGLKRATGLWHSWKNGESALMWESEKSPLSASLLCLT